MTQDEEAKRRVELDRGLRAQRIFEDDLFKDAVRLIREGYLKEFENSPITDATPGMGDKMRLTARIKLAVLQDIVSKLHEHVQTGQMAREDLARSRTN